MSATRRRVCGLVGMAVASYRYRSQRSDEPLRAQLVELAREKPRFGYRRLHILLGRAGEHVNHKRVHRVYRAAGLMIRRKKRKHCVREHGRTPVSAARRPTSRKAREVGHPRF